MPRPTSALIASVCLLAVWIATPLLSVAHVLLVEHSYCAEHERLEEGPNAHASGEQDVRSDTVEHASASPSHAGDSDLAHEDCAFADNFTPEDYFVLATEQASEPAQASASPALLVSALVAESSPLLLKAPKNSPPLLA